MTKQLGKNSSKKGVGMRGSKKEIRTGDRFHRLVVIDKSEPCIAKNGARLAMFTCQCDCGTVKNVRQSCLIKGSTKSCGCLARELSSIRLKKPLIAEVVEIDNLLFVPHPTGFFAATKCGRVIGKSLKQVGSRSNGKYRWASYKDEHGVEKNMYIHRVVADIFVHNPRPDVFNCVNHLDGNKENNAANNLEWVDHTHNTKHAIETNLLWNLPKKGQKGFQRKHPSNETI
jgi:hypothetical protein